MESTPRRVARLAAKVFVISFALSVTTYIVIQAHHSANPAAGPTKENPAGEPALVDAPRNIEDPALAKDANKFLFSSKSAIVPGIEAKPRPTPRTQAGTRGTKGTFLHSSKSLVLERPAGVIPIQTTDKDAKKPTATNKKR